MRKRWEKGTRRGAKVMRKVERAEDGSPDLSPSEATDFRALAARANYLAQDGADCTYIAKELCSEFAVPTVHSYERLVHLCRYLLNVPRLVYHYRWQPEPESMMVFVDADFAGCKATRRSTIGGVVMLGGHCLRHWSTTQSTVSLSSAEAELHGISKGCPQALGLRSMARDLGYDFRIHILTDASAAVGIVRRRRLGRIRHLDVTDLWVQEQIRHKELTVEKIARADNLADALTKNLARPLLIKHLGGMNLYPETGRAQTAPKLS